MNTSMTINATAAWLLALYIATAERQGCAPAKLRGTTQNDIVKEYLSRGTFVFPPEASMRLTSEIVVVHRRARPPLESDQHLLLSPAGSRSDPGAGDRLLDGERHLAARPSARFRRRLRAGPREVFGRISFFLNAGIRFVEEMCKCRAMTALWEEIGRDRYGIRDEKTLRLRYGVQVNSLGLTEAQPENNIVRIALEALGVTLSQQRPHPLAAASGLERGPRPAAALGPAALAPNPANPRLRDGPARVRGSLRRLPRRRGEDPRAAGAPRARSSNGCSRWVEPSPRSRTPT